MNPWLQSLRPAGARTGAVRDRLVCWPHAGGSAAAFQPFATALPDFEVWAVQPPGRGIRMGEPAVVDPDIATEQVAEAIAGLPRGEGGLVVLGHSLGAAMAHLLAVRTGVDLLVLSAWPAPGLGGPHRVRRGDDELLEFMRWLDSPGLDDLDDADVVEYVLPPLAADMEINDALAARADDRRAGCPVLLVHADDDPAFPPADVAAWQEVVDVRDRIRLPGGHFALFDHVGPVARGIAEQLRRDEAELNG